MTRAPDAIVIGAGVVGAACAYYLARDGLRVTVLEAGFVGGGTTAAGMGHVVVMDDSEAQFALTAFSRRLLDELAPVLPRAVERIACGTLWVAEDDAQLAVAREKCAYYRERGVRAELLDAHELAKAEPRLRRGLAGGLVVPDDSVVYPPSLARWLVDEARRAGAELIEGETVRAPDGRMVESDRTRREAAVIVNAAGPAAPSLTPGLPVIPRKGHLAVTARAPELCRHQLVELGYLQSAHTLSGASVAFNVQPRATGQVLVGSSRELVGWDASVNRSVLAQMLERAVAFVPTLAAVPVVRVWTGFRPATPDKLPLVGRWEDSATTWIAAGHEGLGITTALGTGRLLADLVAGRAPEIDPAPFAPSRAMALEA
jgi:D-hydroxyproline dehydrogenase subunit beta